MAAGASKSFAGSSNEVTVEGIEEALGDFVVKKPSDDQKRSAANYVDFTDDHDEPEVEKGDMARGNSAPLDLKRKSLVVDLDVPASQRVQDNSVGPVDVHKSKEVAARPDASDLPAPLSMQMGLDPNCYYAVVIRANSVDVVPVVRCVASVSPYTDGDETVKVNTMVRICRHSKNTGRRAVITGNPD